jgi:O-antigen/teichoic acid export membrane protein
VLRGGYSQWGVIAFLLAFFVLVVVVSHAFLIPALTAANGATQDERRRLAAYSALLLVVVLFCLGVGLFMAFRFGRFFFPRPSSPRIRTKYVDAWAEAGRRMQPPDEPKKPAE